VAADPVPVAEPVWLAVPVSGSRLALVDFEDAFFDSDAVSLDCLAEAVALAPPPVNFSAPAVIVTRLNTLLKSDFSSTVVDTPPSFVSVNSGPPSLSVQVSGPEAFTSPSQRAETDASPATVYCISHMLGPWVIVNSGPQKSPASVTVAEAGRGAQVTAYAVPAEKTLTTEP